MIGRLRVRLLLFGLCCTLSLSLVFFRTILRQFGDNGDYDNVHSKWESNGFSTTAINISTKLHHTSKKRAEYAITEQPCASCYIHIAIACCLSGSLGDRQQLSLTRTFLKSLITFNGHQIHMYVFVNPDYRSPVQAVMEEFHGRGIQFAVDFYNASMPDINIRVKDGPLGTKHVSLSNLFKPCSAQRLFLPYVLQDLDKVIYMDTDTLVLGSMGVVWKQFENFNASHLYGMSFIAKHRGFYDRRPYYQPYKGLTGHNAGVMLMDLAKMRFINWYKITMDIIANLSADNWVYAGDQDILNYYNGLNQDRLYEMSCAHNWRWSLCRKYRNLSQECADANTNGISVLHGVSGTFFKPNVFLSRIYRIFASFEFGSSVRDNLLVPLRSAMLKYRDAVCGNVGDIYLKQILEFLHDS